VNVIFAFLNSDIRCELSVVLVTHMLGVCFVISDVLALASDTELIDEKTLTESVLLMHKVYVISFRLYSTFVMKMTCTIAVPVLGLCKLTIN